MGDKLIGRCAKDRAYQNLGIQGRRCSRPPVRCRDLGSLSEADQATGAVSPTLLALHQMARQRVKRRSPQESQPAQHKVHLTSGATALSWPCQKDGSRTHAQVVFFSELQEGKRDRGAPRKRYKDQPKRLHRHRRESAISHGSTRHQTKTDGAHQ